MTTDARDVPEDLGDFSATPRMLGIAAMAVARVLRASSRQPVQPERD